MMAELQKEILDHLKSQGLDVREIGFKDLITQKPGALNLTRPCVNISINQAIAKKVTLTTYKWICTVSLTIIFQHLQGGFLGDAKRKEGIYKLIEAISDYLTLRDFGLDLENPLMMDSFRNITSWELASAGYQLYELKFRCSYNIKYEELQDRDEGVITSIYSKYFLEPPDSTSVVNTDVLVDSTTILT